MLALKMGRRVFAYVKGLTVLKVFRTVARTKKASCFGKKCIDVRMVELNKAALESRIVVENSRAVALGKSHTTSFIELMESCSRVLPIIS
jgi:hypothetical protein